MDIPDNTVKNLDQDYIIKVRKAYKTYDGKDYVVKGLNMNVNKAQIYCLLGASGCGKTTLINLIMGLIDLDSGAIEATLKRRDEIGYMTQETSLYEQLNIAETFYYYGTIYGFSQDKIKKEMKKYKELLNLPELSNEVKILSGGQRRRVSLAVTLLHNPKLLILDEPTVGTDSILRSSIWDYLIKYCKEGEKTVILTTHYIEEGRKAHNVGFMRDGRLLCERPPQDLMNEFSVDNLEHVFVELCKQDIPVDETSVVDLPPRTPYSLRLNSTTEFNKKKVFGEINKNWIFLKRNLSVVAYTLLLPAFCIALVTYSVGRDPEELKFGVVLEEPGTSLSTCANQNITGKCNMEQLSCFYVEKMKTKILSLNEYKDVNSAINDIKTNQIWGVLHFPANYSTAADALISHLSESSEDTLNSRARLYMDHSSIMIKYFLLREIEDSFKEMIQDVYKSCDWPVNAAKLPIKFEEPIYGKAQSDFRVNFGTSTITLSLLTSPILYGLSVMIEEKKSGAIARSIIAGVGVNEILLSHFIVQSLLQIVDVVTAILIYVFVMGFPFNQPFLTCCLFYFQCIMGITIAFTGATLTDSLLMAGSAIIGIITMTLIAGGIVWPLEGIPFGARIVSWMLPSTLPIDTARTLTIRGWGLENFNVYKGFLTTLTYISVLALFVIFYVKSTRGRAFLKM